MSKSKNPVPVARTTPRVSTRVTAEDVAAETHIADTAPDTAPDVAETTDTPAPAAPTATVTNAVSLLDVQEALVRGSRALIPQNTAEALLQNIQELRQAVK